MLDNEPRKDADTHGKTSKEKKEETVIMARTISRITDTTTESAEADKDKSQGRPVVRAKIQDSD